MPWSKRPRRYKLTAVASRPNAGAAVVCAKVEAELAAMSDDEAGRFPDQLQSAGERPGAAHPQEL